MPLWRDLWEDDAGALVSAELVAVGTVAVLGGGVGLNMLATSVNDELRETAHAIRSFNQSYSVAGHASGRAWAAGSEYIQPDVRESRRKLDELVGDRPAPQEKQKAKPAPRKKKMKKQADEEETAFLQADESALQAPDPVEAADDASKMEVVIEPAPEA